MPKALVGKVNLEGSRAVDNAQITISKGYDVQQNDILTFITDDIDVDHMCGAWHFNHSLRDESGYNLDGKRNDSSSDPIFKTERDQSNQDLRHKGQHYLDCETQRQVIKIKPSSEEANNKIIDFEEGREIHIWIKVPTLDDDETQIIFDRMDSNSGIQIGLYKTNNVTYAYCKTRTKGGSTISNKESETGTAGQLLEVTSGKEAFIDVYSKPDGGSKYKQNYIRVNGGERYLMPWHTTSTLKMEAGVSDIYIGGTSSNGSKFEGKIYSVKIYTRAFEDFQRLTAYKRLLPTSTMKFGGVVSDVKYNSNTITIKAIGYSKHLLASEVDENIFANVSNANNGVFEDMLLEDIMAKIVEGINKNDQDNTGVVLADGKLGKDIDYEFKYVNSIATGGYADDEDDDTTETWKTKTNPFHTRRQSRYNAGGKAIQTARILAILGGKEYNSSGVLNQHLNGADQFYVTPRKTLIFESTEAPNNSYYTKEHGYKIIQNGLDDKNLINDVHVYRGNHMKYKNVHVSSFSSGGTVDVMSLFTNDGKELWDLVAIRALDSDENPIRSLIEGDSGNREFTWDGRKITWYVSTGSSSSFENTTYSTSSRNISYQQNGNNGYGRSRVGNEILTNNSNIGTSINELSFALRKVGTPSGSFYFKIYNGDTEVATSAAKDASDLTTTFADPSNIYLGDIPLWTTLSLTSARTITAGDRVVVEYADTSSDTSGDHIEIMQNDSVSTYTDGKYYQINGGWATETSKEYSFKGANSSDASPIYSVEIILRYIDKTNKGAITGANSSTDDWTYFQDSNQDSIDKYGKRSKKYSTEQMEDATSVASYCRRLMGAKGEPKNSLRIIIPRLINGVNIGMNTTVNHDPARIHNEVFLVKKISYNFPQMITMVTVGDYTYDMVDHIFDIDEAMSSIVKDRRRSTN